VAPFEYEYHFIECEYEYERPFLGYSGNLQAITSFVLFRTQSAAADGTRTRPRSRWLASTSIEHHFQST
jgi:hypothetical protein